MKYRRVGKSGLKVSEISLGSWMTYGDNLKQDESFDCLNRALEQGINHFDTADAYAEGKAEILIGKFLSEIDRKDVVISSKVFWPMSENPNDSGLGRKHIRESIDRSLQRLGTDYLDIYFCHHFDRFTPLDETVDAMTGLIEDGKILHWGTSVWTAHQIERVCGIAKQMGAITPIVEQPRYNMLDRSVELYIMDALSYNGMGMITWSSLFYGILTGKYNVRIPKGARMDGHDYKYQDIETRFELVKVRKLTEIASELDITMAQLALAWILRRNEVSATLIGATKPEQIESNVAAVEVSLNKDVLSRIEELLDNRPEIPYPYNSNMEMT